jgi:hypothetical protein
VSALAAFAHRVEDAGADECRRKDEVSSTQVEAFNDALLVREASHCLAVDECQPRSAVFT